MELSNTQKKVFWALSAHPTYNDRQLAELLGLKRSTVNVARNYLEKHKFYTIHLFPHFERIDVAIIGLLYGDYGKKKVIPYHERLRIRPERLQIPEYIFSMSSNTKGFSMCFAKDLHVLKEPFDAWRALFEDMDSSVLIKSEYFPVQMLCHYKFMDAHRVLAQLLGFDPLPPRKRSVERQRLSKKEKGVLLAWIQDTGATNQVLSQRTGVSRAVIGSMKKRLVKAGVVDMVLIPNWAKLDLNLGAITHLRLKKEDPVVKKLLQKENVIFALGTTYDVFLFSVHKDYNDFQENFGTNIIELKDSGLLTSDAEEILLPLQKSTYTIKPSPLLEKIFH